MKEWLRYRLSWAAEADAGTRDRPAAMARIGAYLFTAGGTIAIVSLALPGAPARDGRAILAAALAAYALACVELIAFDRLPPWAFQVLTACGTGLVSSALYFGGESSQFYRLLYVWVVLYAAYFFTWKQVALQVSFVALAYGIVVFLTPAGGLAPLAWFLTASTLSVVAAVVVLFKGRLEKLLAREREHVERLRELDAMKDEFIATVSHELRTPLASVYGAALTLRERKLDDHGREQMLAVIYREAERLARLVNDISLVNRLDSGRLRAVPASCDPVSLARAVVDAARARVPAGLSLELSAAPSIPPVFADGEKVTQVLTNLVENAVKYSPKGGRVDVELARSDGYVRVTVRDEGIGIPPEEHDRIFEKFHRVDPHMARGVGGTGLGLYISRELVRQAGGRMWVASEDGKGSAFSFELPLATSRGEKPAAAS